MDCCVACADEASRPGCTSSHISNRCCMMFEYIHFAGCYVVLPSEETTASLGRRMDITKDFQRAVAAIQAQNRGSDADDSVPTLRHRNVPPEHTHASTPTAFSAAVAQVAQELTATSLKLSKLTRCTFCSGVAITRVGSCCFRRQW